MLEAFTAVRAAFPRFVSSATAWRPSVAHRTPADDAAVRTAGDAGARALVACASSARPKPAPSPPAAPTTVLRVRRLAGSPTAGLASVAAYLCAVTVLVVPTVALAVPWTELQRLPEHFPPDTVQKRLCHN